jgi:hypothetical protein
MNAEDIARQVASELEPELGQGLTAATDRQLAGSDDAALGKSRAWGLAETAHAAEIALFIIKVAPIALESWREFARDPDRVRLKLQSWAKTVAMPPLETANRVIDSAIEQLKRLP